MEEGGAMAEAPVLEETLSTKEIVDQCLVWHREFNQRKWQGKDSFHNAEHIEANIEASETLIEAARNDNDPLGILDDLGRWNDQHPEAQISQEELSEVIEIAFGLHDTGNIAKRVLKQEGENLEPVFFEYYKADGAEHRSQEIARNVIEASKLTEDQKTRFLPLIKHLINETKFSSTEVVPFGVFIRVVDQIGNDSFSKNGGRTIGLLEEMRAEDPYSEFSPAFFFNFARRRFEQLVPKEETRRAVLEIWGKELPEEKNDLEEELVAITDWLEKRKTANNNKVNF